jgi:hypothetical protein
MSGAVITRRRLLRSAFWSALAGGGLGAALCAGRYALPSVAPPEGRIFVPAARVPGPGAAPVFVGEGRFFLVHLRAGEGAPPRPARACCG